MAESIVTRKAYRYRIYPTAAQERMLNETLARCCELYNAALQERRDAYRFAGVHINYHAQAIQLPEIKESRPEYARIHSQVLQDVLKRVDLAFKAFFRRVKEQKGKAGFPRFKSRFRYDSFTYPQSGFSIVNGKLKLSRIGSINIRMHREIEGEIKTLTIIRSATGKWYACFAVECESEPMAVNDQAVGIDVGLSKFATLSTGEQIDNPRFFRTDEEELAKAQRKLSKLKKGSQEYRKQRKVVARIHERIKNRRKDFAHKLSRYLVTLFGIIVFEDLNIRGMVKNHCLAKSISDASWSQLIQYASYKAANAGRIVVQVDPRYTSQVCSACGVLVEKTLSERIHNCSDCGLTLDRDLNAALNILGLGLQSVGLSSHRSRFLQGAE